MSAHAESIEHIDAQPCGYQEFTVNATGIRVHAPSLAAASLLVQDLLTGTHA